MPYRRLARRLLGGPYGREVTDQEARMSRKHVFAIVVLLSAAAVAGLLAVTRTTAAARPASNAQITAKSRSLDRLEESLRRALAEQPPTRDDAAAPRVVLVPSTAQPAADDHGEGDDDADEQEHEDADD